MLDDGEDQLAASQMFQRQELVQRLKEQTETPAQKAVSPTASAAKSADYPVKPCGHRLHDCGRAGKSRHARCASIVAEAAQQAAPPPPAPAPPPIAVQVAQPASAPSVSSTTAYTRVQTVSMVGGCAYRWVWDLCLCCSQSLRWFTTTPTIRLHPKRLHRWKYNKRPLSRHLS